VNVKIVHREKIAAIVILPLSPENLSLEIGNTEQVKEELTLQGTLD